MIERIKKVLTITSKLESFQIPYSLGGSGVLVSLGLRKQVSDWDLITDAPIQEVYRALHPFVPTELECGDFPYGTRYKLFLEIENEQIEIIGFFSIHTAIGLVQFPVTPVSRWQELNVGSPEVWYVAYTLMSRINKADLLLSYLRKNGANQEMVQFLLSEPLPQSLKDELTNLVQG